MKELFLTTNYGVIPVTESAGSDERFIVLRDKSGAISVEFAKETIERYKRGEIKRLLA